MDKQTIWIKIRLYWGVQEKKQRKLFLEKKEQINSIQLDTWF